LDLDIQELEILMLMEAYDAAHDLYTYGKHTTTASQGGLTSSLQLLANNAEISVVPKYDAFVRYYDDNKFADTIVKSALTEEKYDAPTRRILVIGTCQYLIMYLAVLQKMQEAIVDCEANQASTDVSSAHYWDTAAALIVGHLEGPENEGFKDGKLLFGLARDHCTEFGTCSSPSDAALPEASVNDQIRSLLYSGRGAILGRSCSELRKVSMELEPLILIPIIQGLLSSALKISSTVHHAMANVLASVVLPLIDNSNREDAKRISASLTLDSAPPSDTVDVILNALPNLYSSVGLSCTQISSNGLIDCSGGGGSNSSGSKGKVVLVFGILFVLMGVGIGVLLMFKPFRKEPIFLIPAGEMNHTDDLLHKSGGSAETHEETPMLEEELDEQRRAAIMAGESAEVDVV